MFSFLRSIRLVKGFIGYIVNSLSNLVKSFSYSWLMSELIAKGYLLRKFLGIDISGKRIKIIMRGKMKRVVFVIGIALFILAIILCIQARTAYPKPIYEPIYPDDPRYTGEVIEWFDRASGWEVQWALVYDPNNPTWVDIFQGDTSFFIFVGLFVLCSLSRPLRKAK